MTDTYLVIEARFYDAIADELFAGARAALMAEDADYERWTVPGVLEIPAALSIAVDATERGKKDYAGYILLGCVIRGETSHYDIVANESARAIYDLVVNKKLALGNGVLTVENKDQAMVRAKVSQKNKGADAALAAIALRSLQNSVA